MIAPPSLEGDATHRNLEDFSHRASRFRASLQEKETSQLEKIISQIRFGPGDSIIDIGIGTANASLPFLKAGGRVVGIELTPAMARQGKASLEEKGLGERVVFAIAQAEHSPLANDMADAAICRNVFHHLQAPAIILEEMARAVRPGGHVIIDDFYEPDSDDERAMLHEIECLRVPSHVRTLSVSEFRALFEKAGLPIMHLSATFKRRTLSSWLDLTRASSENIMRIRLRFEQMHAAGGGWWEVEKQDDDYLFSHKRMVIIGKKK